MSTETQLQACPHCNATRTVEGTVVQKCDGCGSEPFDMADMPYHKSTDAIQELWDVANRFVNEWLFKSVGRRTRGISWLDEQVQDTASMVADFAAALTQENQRLREALRAAKPHVAQIDAALAGKEAPAPTRTRTLTKIMCPSCSEMIDLATDCALPNDQLVAARREIERLREALQEARMFVGSHALGQTMTHRADTLLKHIVQALNQPPPAKP